LVWVRQDVTVRGADGAIGERLTRRLRQSLLEDLRPGVGALQGSSVKKLIHWIDSGEECQAQND